MAKRADTLVKYRQKRDFTITPEPKGIPEKKSGSRYLIQKHAASRLHYDFRLEMDGVLKSWAVTRGPSIDPHDRRLAVEVEDHPVAYGTFEGIIPKGQYGGGTVMLWDEGTWEPIGDPREGLKKGKLVFNLQGKRLKGEWTLVRMKPREKDKERNNWLLIKHKDTYAKVGGGDTLLEKSTTSIVSNRTMEEIAASADRIWQGKQETKTPKRKTVVPHQGNAKPVKMPGFIKPELATLVTDMPKGEAWVHEIKFDGYRTLAYIHQGKVRMFTRNGLDWTSKFLHIAKQLQKLKVETAILDGEIAVSDEEGISSFKLLQAVLSEAKSEQLQYYCFDLIYLDGKDLRGLPLSDRKSLLQELIGKGLGNRIFYSEHFAQQDADFLQRVCGLQLEGIISKRLDATYTSGRGKAWVKTKCSKRQEFVIGGFTLPTHAHRGIGALLLGHYENDELIYAGKVGTGFDTTTSQSIRKKLDKLAQKTSPFQSVSADGKRGAHWVKPQLVCEVQFTEWTTDGHLRHPSFQGLREDKPAPGVSRDIPIHNTASSANLKPKSKSKPVKSIRDKGTVLVGETRISHPQRIIYPGTEITKRQLAEYYLEIAEHILPHVIQRPLSMVRCPEGSGEPCFFQRHVGKGQSPHIYDTGIKVKGRNESYLMIKDIHGLLALIQWGVIELHPWGCKVDNPQLPDRLIFDLDPDPGIEWKNVIEATKEVRDRMAEFGLQSFLKTTGGKGLHVVVPIAHEHEWPAIKAFTRAIAQSMEHDSPSRYTTNVRKAARQGKIFVDYLRNELTSTAVAPYSARAREGATVATPLQWSELKSTLIPGKFTIETVPYRLKKLKADPWEEMLEIKQKLSSRYLRALKIVV